jgi:hypothetical protein
LKTLSLASLPNIVAAYAVRDNDKVNFREALLIYKSLATVETPSAK